jgi:Spy/CpxP family protein refolding chaperone
MKKKFCAFALALSAALPVAVVATSSPAAAQPPGQCKQVNGNCNGQSESAPPHCEEFSNGWQKKLGC